MGRVGREGMRVWVWVWLWAGSRGQGGGGGGRASHQERQKGKKQRRRRKNNKGHKIFLSLFVIYFYPHGRTSPKTHTTAYLIMLSTRAVRPFFLIIMLSHLTTTTIHKTNATNAHLDAPGHQQQPPCAR